jgi:hypothetical protein
MAMARGITPMVNEPLTQSSSIDNPQRSQALSQAMGMPGEGFGTAPLDANRQFMTADYYKKFLRRSTVTQESSDEANAFSNMLSQGEIPLPSSGAFSMATVRGQERQQQIEMAAEALASRLETLRQRASRIKYPLPAPSVGKIIMDTLYNMKGKRKGDKVIFTPETIQDMSPLQLLISINWNIQHLYAPDKAFPKLTEESKKYNWMVNGEPSQNLIRDLRALAYSINKNDQSVRIPFSSTSLPQFKHKDYAELFQAIKNGGVPELANEVRTGTIALQNELQEMDLDTMALQQAEGPAIEIVREAIQGPAAPTIRPGNQSRKARRKARREAAAAPTMEVIEMPDAPAAASAAAGGAGGPGPVGDKYSNMTAKELKAELKARKMNQSGNKEQMLAKLRA